MAAGIGSSPPATLNWIRQIKKNNGWMGRVHPRQVARLFQGQYREMCKPNIF